MIYFPPRALLLAAGLPELTRGEPFCRVNLFTAPFLAGTRRMVGPWGFRAHASLQSVHGLCTPRSRVHGEDVLTASTSPATSRELVPGSPPPRFLGKLGNSSAW